MAGESKPEELRARASLYRLFGALLYREAPLEWLGDFQRRMRHDWEDAGCCFDADMGGDIASLKDAIDTEFTSLWIAPGGVARFESVFVTGAVFQSPCDEVAAIYRAEGYDFDMDAENTFPDHAGVELEFLGHLLGRQAEAFEAADDAEALRLEKVETAFLRDHAGKWVPAMMNQSIRLAEHSFYRELCGFILGFMDSEIETLLPRRDRERLQASYGRKPKEMEYDADFRKSSGL